MQGFNQQKIFGNNGISALTVNSEEIVRLIFALRHQLRE